jgi:serine protease
MKSRIEVACVVVIVLALSGCGKETPVTTSSSTTTTTTATGTSTTTTPPAVAKVEATPEALKKAEEAEAAAAERDRKMRACLTFDDFEATVYREPFEGGKYIVNGDTPIANKKLLREFYEKNVKTSPQDVTLALAINQIGGLDDKWNQDQKRKLSYCVSNAFGSRHNDVVNQMASATGAWEKVAAVHYIYDSTQDANCVPSNTAVVFDVRPVNVDGEYLARAFFPNEPRVSRNVLIDDTSFGLSPSGKLQLVGILRHELGHTVGFRHEHTRPESGKCFEDKNWRPLTSYDAFSVMHYPQCNGRGDWSLTLTDKDKNGVACVYGPNPPFTIDPALVTSGTPCAVDQVAPVASQPQTKSFNAQSVAKDAEKPYGPFAVVAGSPMIAAIGGAGATGDPDLYVRFDAKPTAKIYDCRPFVDGPTEVCSVTVPAGNTQVFVMVRGYAKGTYDLNVTHTPPAGGTP